MPSINTSLQIKFSTCSTNNCSAYNFFDTTGDFNSGTNLTGWGVSNPITSDVDTCTLDVTKPDGIVISLDLLALSGGAFPNAIDIPILITSVLMNSGLKNPDGVYTFVYTCTGDSNNGADVTLWSSSITGQEVFDCQVQCCLDKLFSTIDPIECLDCKDKTLERVIKAYMNLISAKKAICCGQGKRASKLIKNAQFICGQTICESC